MLFDHVDLRVSNLAKARPLYDALLPAMGYSSVSEDEENICYYHPQGLRANAFMALTLDSQHRPNESRLALRGVDRDDVDRLAEVARLNGARNFEHAQEMPEYSAGYYATFFEDADGNKFEICHRGVDA